MTEYVACKHCGDLTRMLGTRECDRCHELWLRIRSDPELASKALEEFTQHQRDRIQAAQEYDAEQAKPKLTRGVKVPVLTDEQIDAVWHSPGPWSNEEIDYYAFARAILAAAAGVAPTHQTQPENPMNTTNLQPHQQLVAEKADLDERLNKLLAFTANPIFSSLSLNERNLLVEQAGYMQAYSNVLGQRIAAFAP